MKKIIVFILSVFFIQTTFLNAKYTDNSINNAVESYIKKLDNFKGLSIAVMKNDKLIFAKAYGYANATDLLTIKHRFAIGSVTKSITAAAIMKLVQEDKLSLNDNVFTHKICKKQGIIDVDYLKYSKKIMDKYYFVRICDIQVKHLLEHTAGLSRYVSPRETIKRSIRKTFDKKYQFFFAKEFKVAQEYHYSNFGYHLLGEIISLKTNMPYIDYIRNKFLLPSYYSSIDFHPIQKKNQKEVQYFSEDGFGSYEQWLSRNSAYASAVSTAIDLVKFGTQFNENIKINNMGLNTHTIKEIKTVSKKRFTYAKGWTVLKNGRVWQHGGRLGIGLRSVLKCKMDKYNKDTICVSILANSNVGRLYNLSDIVFDDIKGNRWFQNLMKI